MRAMLVLICAAALAGCASPPPQPTWQQREALNQLQQCLSISAEDLDDGVSNARTVGVAVVKACRPELDRFIGYSVAGQGSAYAYGFLSEAERGAVDRATELVLRKRAARR